MLSLFDLSKKSTQVMDALSSGTVKTIGLFADPLT